MIMYRAQRHLYPVIFVHLTVNQVKFWKTINYVYVLCFMIPICLMAAFLSIAYNDLLSTIMTHTVITMLRY